MKASKPQIEESWYHALKTEFEAPYFAALKAKLQAARATHTVYPPGPQIFTAFNLTPVADVKVVLIGQDPYHGPEQAHGLCFSVNAQQALPPSLRNIFKELRSDLQQEPPRQGDLRFWARQGVLMLNTTLTVNESQAGSHRGWGWERFTDAAIRYLAEKREQLVFMLWGKHAQEKARFIDPGKHLILQAAHPSPFSAHRGFLGCRHFSKANAYLQKQGLKPIGWCTYDS